LSHLDYHKLDVSMVYTLNLLRN